jgi:hypothetical protein
MYACSFPALPPLSGNTFHVLAILAIAASPQNDNRIPLPDGWYIMILYLNNGALNR